MGFDRTNLLRGPAKVTLGGGDFFSDGDISIAPVINKADRNVGAFGVVKRPVTGMMVDVTVTPTQYGNLATLFPYGAMQIGTSIYGPSDAPCVITPINGSPLTLANAAIIQSPSLILGAGANTFGACTIRGIIANDTDSGSLAAYLSQASSASGVPLTGLDKSKILNGAYLMVRNGVTYYSETDFQVDFALGFSDQEVAGFGVVDSFLNSVVVSVTMRPAGLTEAAYIALLGMDTKIGAEATRYPITIAGANSGEPSIVINNTEVDPGSLQYGDQNRLGQLVFRSARDHTTGAVDTLFTVGTVD